MEQPTSTTEAVGRWCRPPCRGNRDRGKILRDSGKPSAPRRAAVCRMNDQVHGAAVNDIDFRNRVAGGFRRLVIRSFHYDVD